MKKTKQKTLLIAVVALLTLLAVLFVACDDDKDHANTDPRPRLTVVVVDQDVPYVTAGAEPYTDTRAVEITGELKEGHSVTVGVTREGEGVLLPGESAALVFDGTVAITDESGADVTAEYIIDASLAEGAKMTVVKGIAKLAAAKVDYDGNPHSFADNAPENIFLEGAEQEYEIHSPEATHTTGGAHAYAITLFENELWAAQETSIYLSINSVAVDGEVMSIDDAFRLPATADSPVTVEMFTDTVLPYDITVPANFVLVLRDIADTDTAADSDISDTVGAPTYLDGTRGTHVDGNPDFIENTLTVRDGATLTVEGAVIVSGVLGQEKLGLSGHTSGKHSVLALEDGAAAVVRNGGVLDVRGYVTGEGSLSLLDGSSAYIPFVVYDYCGGSNSAICYLHGEITPFNLFDLFYNLQADTVVKSGASVTSYLDLYASSTHNTSQAQLAGADGEGFFIMGDDAELRVSFERNDDFASASGRNTISMTGDILFGDISVKVMFTMEVSLSSVRVPFSQRMDIRVGDGVTPTTLTIPHDIKLLPGANFVVEKNADVKLTGSMIVYSEINHEKFLADMAYPEADAGVFELKGTLEIADGAAFGGKITAGADGAKVVTAATSVMSVNSTEGDCGGTQSALGIGGIFYKRFDITEAARFDDGVLSESADTEKTDAENKNYAWVEHLRVYTSASPLQAGKTYTYSSAGWSD